MEKNEIWGFIKKITLITLGAIIVAIVSSWLFEISFIKEFFKSKSEKPLFVIGAIIAGILIFFWEKIWSYWKRYKETKKTGEFPLVFIDYIIIYIIEIAILLKGIETSKDFTYFLGFLLIILLILFFRWPVSFLKGFIKFFKILFTKKKSIEKDNGIIIFSDDPITSKKQDKLRREKFVTDLSQMIINLPLELTRSFTIGLNGSWGEGKTSVINLLIETLKASSDFDNKFLLIQFDPWYFGDEKAIVNAFYDQLEKTFSERFIFSSIKKSISRYFKIISTGVSLPGIKFDIHSPIVTIEKTKELIGNYIQKVGKKVLIIIDDIDRLQPDEMALVFKLVRQNLNFKNTIFLLSFDESIVRRILKDEISLDGDFLDKIINMPIPLPPIEQQNIEAYLLEEIKLLLKTIGIPEAEIIASFDGFQSIYKSHASTLFKTLRITKRYMNSLYATLPSIISEVNPIDYIILEIIKVFNNNMYEKIWKNQDIFAPTSLSQLSLNAKKKLNWQKNSFILDSTVHAPYAFLFEGIDIDIEPKEIFDALLKSLFPLTYGKISSGQNYDVSNIYKNRDKKPISHPDCFQKYFLLQVPILEISDEVIEKMISKWEFLHMEERKAAIKQEMFKTGPDKLTTSKLMEKFEEFNEKISSSLALSIIEVIYENANAFEKGKNIIVNDWLSSEFSKAAEFIIFLIEKKIEKKNQTKILEDSVMKTPDLLFSSYIISNYNQKVFNEKKVSDSDFIDLKPLKDKVGQKLKEYFVDNKIDIFEKYEPGWSFILYGMGTYWGEYDGQFSDDIQDYVFSLVKDDVHKFYKLLYRIIDQPRPLSLSFRFERFKKYYNVIKFKEIALKFKDDEALSKEEKLVLNEFLKYTQGQPQIS